MLALTGALVARSAGIGGAAAADTGLPSVALKKHATLVGSAIVAVYAVQSR